MYLKKKKKKLATFMQRISTYYKRPLKNKKAKFEGSPQKRCVVQRLRICTPRKPNSARRPVAKVRLSNKKRALAHIPGTGLGPEGDKMGNNLKKFSKVLINGNAARDLPVVNYTCIRGVLDFSPVTKIKRRRSIYGLKQNPSLRTHIRRKLRNLN